MMLGQFAGLRGIAAVAMLAVLLYWTYERAVGEGEDPTIRKSVSTATGSSSFLVSGSYAVMFVAGGFTVLLLPEIKANPALLAVPVGIVVAHWIVEKEERET